MISTGFIGLARRVGAAGALGVAAWLGMGGIPSLQAESADPKNPQHYEALGKDFGRFMESFADQLNRSREGENSRDRYNTSYPPPRAAAPEERREAPAPRVAEAPRGYPERGNPNYNWYDPWGAATPWSGPDPSLMDDPWDPWGGSGGGYGWGGYRRHRGLDAWDRWPMDGLRDWWSGGSGWNRGLDRWRYDPWRTDPWGDYGYAPPAYDRYRGGYGGYGGHGGYGYDPWGGGW
ncbi:MAG: hypothetical protein HQL51_16580 [Magnetococcales bacterium]|nr:hypothetical protein [Magnetococcales bacterium]